MCARVDVEIPYNLSFVSDKKVLKVHKKVITLILEKYSPVRNQFFEKEVVSDVLITIWP
uniref:Uncharacterized protein n=1 Tax=Romanomermis culicivorax TaxID=13658 RepID=A0A915KY57_ROMCU